VAIRKHTTKKKEELQKEKSLYSDKFLVAAMTKPPPRQYWKARFSKSDC
jgi:hypothetical protein